MLKRYFPNKDGLEKFLGSLEIVVMTGLWAGKRTIRQIHSNIIVTDQGDYAYTTIETVVSRLMRKGLITRKKENGVHYYTPVHSSEEEFTNAMVLIIINTLAEDFRLELEQTIERFYRNQLTQEVSDD